MNIFSVFSTGNSSLREPSMSSMLAFLLNPTQDHGLGRKIIDNFLETADQKRYGKYVRSKTIRFEIDLEVPYLFKGKRNMVDVQIRILNDNYNELHRIIIENKIKASSADPKQLQSYYQAVLNDPDQDAKLKPDQVSVIFLTPFHLKKGLKDQFDNLKTTNKTWMHWNGSDTSFVSLIQILLDQESRGEISPMNEYIRHTLKAFCHYVIQTISVTGDGNRVGEDIGEVKRRANIEIDNELYTIVLRDSGQIQLLDSDGDKQIARPLLRSYLAQEGIPEKKPYPTTRRLGNQILKHLN